MSGKSDREQHEKLLKALQPGQSFFLENVTPIDCIYIRRLGYKLGLKLAMRAVTQDEIFGTAGTRVMRTK
jgi:hypothetical protein